MLTSSYFQEAIPVHCVYGDGPTVLAVGENGSGKSFLRKVIQSRYDHVYSVSMEGRRGVAYNPATALMYGDEGMDPTGLNSARMIQQGIRTSRGAEKDHIMIFDEPDLGMSEGLAMGTGSAFQEFLKDPPPRLLACVIITHSRPLLRKLSLPHTFLHFGGKGTLEDYLQSSPVERSYDDLKEVSHNRWKSVQGIINEKARQKKVST